MCEPLTATTATAAASAGWSTSTWLIAGAIAVGGAASVVLARDAEAQRQKMSRMKKQIALNQAREAEYEAAYAQKKAAYDAEQQRRLFFRSRGESRSMLAASGAGMDSGSSLDLLADSAGRYAQEQSRIMHQGNMDSWRAEHRQRSMLSQAGMYDLQGQPDRVLPWHTGLTVLNTGRRVSSLLL